MSPLMLVGSLCLVALGLLCLATWRWRSGRAAALIIGAAAVAVGWIATMQVWPRLTDVTEAMEIDALRQQLAKANATLTEERLAGRTIVAKLDAALARNSEADIARTREVAAAEEALRALQQRFRAGTSDVMLDLPPRAPPSVGATVDERADAVLANLKDLHFLRARPAPALPPRPEQTAREETTRDLMKLRDTLARPIKTEAYEVEPYPARELIGGRQGRYYTIDIKNAASGVRYFFEGGKYTLRTGTAEFRSSLNTFVSDVLARMDGNVRYDLYVRGSADQKPYEGRMDPDAPYHKVSALRALGPDKYAMETVETQFDRGTVRNVDLPNLRAAFMRDLVAATYPVKPPIILQGAVTPKTDERDRNVELILFVEW